MSQLKFTTKIQKYIKAILKNVLPSYKSCLLRMAIMYNVKSIVEQIQMCLGPIHYACTLVCSFIFCAFAKRPQCLNALSIINICMFETQTKKKGIDFDGKPLLSFLFFLFTNGYSFVIILGKVRLKREKNDILQLVRFNGIFEKSTELIKRNAIWLRSNKIHSLYATQYRIFSFGNWFCVDHSLLEEETR